MRRYFLQRKHDRPLFCNKKEGQKPSLDGGSYYDPGQIARAIRPYHMFAYSYYIHLCINMSRKILCSYSITFVRLQVLEVQLVLDTCLAGSGEGAVVLQ